MPREMWTVEAWYLRFQGLSRTELKASHVTPWPGSSSTLPGSEHSSESELKNDELICLAEDILRQEWHSGCGTVPPHCSYSGPSKND